MAGGCLQGVLHCGRRFAPEILGCRRHRDFSLCVGRPLWPSDRHQLVPGAEPVTRQAHDIAQSLGAVPAIFTLSTILIHELCRPFLVIRRNYVLRGR